MAQGVTLSSTGTSSIIDLNPVFKETTFQVVVSAGSSGTSYIQVALDDPIAGSTVAVTWAALSSAINSSAADGIGQTLTMLAPVSATRLLVQSSTTTGIVGSVSMRVIQSVTG